ncbi:cyclase family protein [Legionella fallonii]|uniref:Putative cyclase n=1 Tax=Legionella fallonii LLAP-10 TaxID=1212491 RepID=A0A098G944_9GAMM|nr:cyclase family protein [Legionella fallonii]CEG58524.1 putative cyclase [Legionella fallonii LLAP-10]
MKQFPFKFIELTHSINQDSPCWETGCGFTTETMLNYSDCTTAVKFKVQSLKMDAGIGTHIDSPAHCVSGGKTTDELPLEELLAPCVVIDVSSMAHETYCLTVEDISDFENNYGRIKEGSFVIIYTGWDKYWLNPDKYRNNLSFPSVSEKAAQLLLQRGIIGLGIDTLSPDTPESDYPVHQIILGSGKYLIENVANAQAMPPIGGFTLALPIRLQGMTEAPIRLIGLVNKN